ncbi:MAG TPA: DsbC family protein [Rhodocyclaceae bacterium]|jgi:thiol:disulfide interchange protein DsbC|nr:DsbC family protein [Rhodocyclaceae bacterium]
MKKIMSIAGLVAAFLLSCSVWAGEAEVRKVAQSFVGDQVQIDGVRKTNMLGLYEIQIGPDVYYMDEKGAYFIEGQIIDVKNKRNLTAERKNKLAQINFSDLPLGLAIKQVRGNGKRVFATFEDPNCGYCKRLAKDLQGMTDVTIYTFIYPILAQDSVDKARNIMCSPNQAKAWNDWMLNGVVPPTLKCDISPEKVVALGQKLNVRGTPNIFLADGSRIGGAVPAAELEKQLNAVAQK